MEPSQTQLKDSRFLNQNPKEQTPQMDVGPSVEPSCCRDKWKGLCHGRVHRLGSKGWCWSSPLWPPGYLSAVPRAATRWPQASPTSASGSSRFPPTGTEECRMLLLVSILPSPCKLNPPNTESSGSKFSAGAEAQGLEGEACSGVLSMSPLISESPLRFLTHLTHL